MAREYQKTVWQNEPNTSTPLDADNLNHIENGIYDLETKVENKVDKVNGKGLSTNDFTDEKNSKLAGIETGAQVNVQSDFSQNDSSANDYIKNKPNMANYATKTYVDNSFTIAGKKSDTTLGTNATAEGTNNTVTGGYGHGEGNGNTASGYAAHAENYETTASGFFSHSQGYGTIANGESQHVAGKFNVADNNNAYAEIIGGGSSDDSRANIRTLDWNGNAKYSGNVYAQNDKILAKAEDVYTKSEVDAKVSSAYHPAGTKTVAQLTSSLLVAANIGNVYNITDSGTTTEYFSEGSGKPIRAGDNVGICNFGTDSYPFILFDLLSGFVDTSEFATNSAVNTALSGKVDKVNGKGLSTNDYTTSEKEKLANINLTNYATKDYVDESYTIAGKAADTTVGSYSTAEGHNNTATGNHVHVEGYGNTATGAGNHAEGYGNTISGEYGHVEGTENTVSGYRTHVEGTGNIGSGYAQHVSGKYNVADNNSTYAEIVGGGEDSTHRANIRTLDWDGTGRYAGDLYVHDSRKVLDTNDKKEVASTFKDKYDESSIPSTYTTKYYSMGHPSAMYPAADYGSATTCCINVENGNWYSYTDSPDDAWVLEDELPLRGGGTADNLTDLGDVNINSPLGGQVLAYNNSQQKWYNKSLKEYGGVKEQAIDASETIYPLSKITSELELLLFRVDGQLHTGQYVYYVEAEGKYFVTDTNGKLFKSYWLHYNTQEEYYSEVNTNIEFTKFLWVSNDNIIGYSTDGYLYYASRNGAFNGNFTQSEEIGTNLDFVNFYEFDGDVYCVTNNSVWMSQTFGQTWMRIKTGAFTNSMCGGGILAYTTSTKVYVECVGENDFKEYNLPITNGKTIYGKGLFICYTDGEIHVSYDGCRRWIEKQTFIKNGSVVYVSDLTDDLLIRYTKGIFGICNDNVWDLSFDFDNLIIISDYANDDYVSLWCNYSDNKYVYDVDSFGEFYYGEYLTTNIPQKVENNLAELHDVATNNLQNNQILKYNAASQKWVNGNLPSASITPTLSEGTKIADYSINGVNGELFTPDLSTSLTATGNPLTIESSESNLVECKAKVECVQEGSGEPSPDNIRPIIGQTEVVIPVVGKNLFNKNDVIANKVPNTSGGLSDQNGTDTTEHLIPLEPSTAYTISGNSRIRFWTYGKNGNYLNTFLQDAGTFTTDAQTYFIRISGNSGWQSANIQIEEGSTATPYEPYKGKTYRVEIGQKNKLPMTVDGIKSANTSGSWSGNVYTYNGVTFTIQTDSQGLVTGIRANGTFSANTSLRLPDFTGTTGTAYIASGCPSNGSRSTYDMVIYGAGYDTGNSLNFSANGNVQIVAIEIFANQTVNNLLFQPMIRTTIDDSEFAPYNPNLPSAIYGGELDVVTGKLRVTHEFDVLDGSSDENWSRYSSGSAGSYAMLGTLSKPFSYLNSTVKPPFIANELETIKQDETWGDFDNFISAASGGITTSFYAGIRSITTVEAWRTYLASNPLQVVYELAEPYTIQLTPQQIRLLKGTNHLSCNTGDLTIKYYPDNVLGQLKGDIEDEIDAVANKIKGVKTMQISGGAVSTDGSIMFTNLIGSIIVGTSISNDANSNKCVGIPYSMGSVPALKIMNESTMSVLSNVHISGILYYIEL